MGLRRLTQICLAGLLAGGATAAGCGGGNNPSNGFNSTTTSSTGGSSSNTSSGSNTTSGASSSAGGASSSSTGSTSSESSNDAGVTLQCGDVTANTTTCEAGVTPECVKGCGPDLPQGSSQPQLGTKVCSCPSGVYTCDDCSYLLPEPSCYEYAGAAPPACAASVNAVDKGPCATPCDPSSGMSGVCTILSDAGKTDGCVCVGDDAGTGKWTCQTLWNSQ